MDDTGCVSQRFDQKGVLTVLNEEGALEEDDEEEMNRRNGKRQTAGPRGSAVCVDSLVYSK
jgi:hypothetical protein